MLEYLKKIFSEASDISSMRIMSFLSLIIGAIVSLIGLFKGSELFGLATLAGVFVGSAFGGKVLQKIQEIKGEKQ